MKTFYMVEVFDVTTEEFSRREYSDLNIARCMADSEERNNPETIVEIYKCERVKR